MPATIASVNFGDTVLCTNKGTETAQLKWNGKAYLLPPGKKVPVSFDAVVNGLGDPRSGTGISPFFVGGEDGGEKGFIPDRASEIRRLRNKYGNGIALPHTMASEDRVWGAPDILVETYEGEKIWTVAEDPEGTQASPVRSIGDLSPTDLQAQVNRLQAQLNALTERRGADPEDDIPYDTGGAQMVQGDEDVEASPVTTMEGEATLSKVKFPAADE